MFAVRARPILYVAPHSTNALQCCTSSPDSVLSVHWLPADSWRSVGLHRDDAVGSISVPGMAVSLPRTSSAAGMHIMQTCLLSEQYIAPLSEGCRTPAVHAMQPEVKRQRADHKHLVGYSVLQPTKGGSMLQPHMCWIVVHSCSKSSLVPSFRGRRLHRLKPHPQSWPGCLRWGRGAVLGVPCLQTLADAASLHT
jgi:hypothetical protein